MGARWVWLHRPPEGGEILHQSTPPYHVENLKPLADTQKGEISFESPPGKSHLKAIEKGKGLSQTRLGLFSPEKRSHISPPGENHSVHSPELLIQYLGLKVLHLRKHQGNPPGLLHRPDIVIGDITPDLSLGGMGLISRNTDYASLCHGG